MNIIINNNMCKLYILSVQSVASMQLLIWPHICGFNGVCIVGLSCGCVSPRLKWEQSLHFRRGAARRRAQWECRSTVYAWYTHSFILLHSIISSQILRSLAGQWATGFAISLGHLQVLLLRPMWSLFFVGHHAGFISMSSLVVLCLSCHQLVSSPWHYVLDASAPCE